MVKGPHENLDDLAAYLERQLEIAGVNVTLNKEVDQALIDSEAPTRSSWQWAARAPSSM